MTPKKQITNKSKPKEKKEWKKRIFYVSAFFRLIELLWYIRKMSKKIVRYIGKITIIIVSKKIIKNKYFFII